MLQIQKPQAEIMLADRAYTVNNRNKKVELLLKNLHYHFWVKHYQTPPSPSIEQLRSTIRTGDDSAINYLVLTTDGRFGLFSPSQLSPFIKNPKIVAMHSSFGPYCDNVGEAAADDQGFIERLFSMFLSSWLKHLKTNTTYFRVDDPPEQSTQEIMAEIDQWNDDTFS